MLNVGKYIPVPWILWKKTYQTVFLRFALVFFSGHDYDILNIMIFTPLKFNSKSPEKLPRAPTGKDRLPTTIFQGRAVKLREGIVSI